MHDFDIILKFYVKYFSFLSFIFYYTHTHICVNFETYLLTHWEVSMVFIDVEQGKSTNLSLLGASLNGFSHRCS